MNIRLVVPPFVERQLAPTEILCEVLFGLIMVLTFTLGAGLIVEAGGAATRKMLLGVIGCNLAWGLIDGVMHAMSCMLERSRKAQLLKAIQRAESVEAAQCLVARHFSVLEAYTAPDERQPLYAAILRRLKAAVPECTVVSRDDVLGGLAKFWLVFVSTIPATLPFLLIDDRFLALRVSNGLLLAMLFLTGYRWAQETNSRPWLVGTTLLLGGVALVAVAMALGG